MTDGLLNILSQFDQISFQSDGNMMFMLIVWDSGKKSMEATTSLKDFTTDPEGAMGGVLRALHECKTGNPSWPRVSTSVH